MAQTEYREEARLTAHLMGNVVRSCYDVGVAGIHRLFAHMDMLEKIIQGRFGNEIEALMSGN